MGKKGGMNMQGANEKSNITNEMKRYSIFETLQGWSNKEQLKNQE